MPDYSASNKKLAKNTAFLYFRMLLLTLISLYTVRITFEALGEVDYGIYNVVASVVASLSFLSATLTSATQRFLSFHLGKNDYVAYSNTFSLLLIGYLVISVVIIIIGEITAPLFVEKWLNIPPDRFYAAKWVFQTAIFTFVFHILTVPYSSSIVANEKMDAFAYISIADGILKLLLVFLLLRSPIDRLIYYGILTCLLSAIILFLHIAYCRHAFPYCKFRWIWDKSLFKELTSYTGFNLFGSVSGMLVTSGQNVLLNIFFGPVVNAAKAIADRISSIVNQFSANFYMAVSPQIVKSYAAGDTVRMINLALKSTRLSFFLLLIVSVPLIVAMKNILSLWLTSEMVTDDMIGFSQLTLIFCMVMALEQPVTQMIRATGNIKRYQLSVGLCTLMYIPIAWLVLKLGASAVSTMQILILLYCLVQVVRIMAAHRQVGLDIHRYFREVVVPIALVSGLCVIEYLAFSPLTVGNNLVDALVKGGMTFLVSLALIWWLGLTKDDRIFVMNLLRRKKHIE